MRNGRAPWLGGPYGYARDDTFWRRARQGMRRGRFAPASKYGLNPIQALAIRVHISYWLWREQRMGGKPSKGTPADRRLAENKTKPPRPGKGGQGGKK